MESLTRSSDFKLVLVTCRDSVGENTPNSPRRRMDEVATVEDEGVDSLCDDALIHAVMDAMGRCRDGGIAC